MGEQWRPRGGPEWGGPLSHCKEGASLPMEGGLWLIHKGDLGGQEASEDWGRENYQGPCVLTRSQVWTRSCCWRSRLFPLRGASPDSTRSPLSQSLPPGQGPQCRHASSGSSPGPAAHVTSVNAQVDLGVVTEHN